MTHFLRQTPSLLLPLLAAALVACGNDSTDDSVDAGGGPTGNDDTERAIAACDVALSGLDDYQEGFCAIAAALAAEDSADAGANVSCEDCASGNDESQQLEAEMRCVESVEGCPNLSDVQVRACLEAARPTFDAQSLTCSNATAPGARLQALGFFLSLAAISECEEFLGCGDLLTNLTSQ